MNRAILRRSIGHAGAFFLVTLSAEQGMAQQSDANYEFLYVHDKLDDEGDDVDSARATTPAQDLPQFLVLGKKNDRLFSRTPGSLNYMGRKKIEQVVPVSGNDVLRKFEGLNVVDEEGAGLRVNVGVRGLDPDRSRNVLILEDGIPVALNPYGEPEMYFTPLIDKVVGVEVLKGSGQLLYGPQTIGGVINYITADPPERLTNEIRLQGGMNGYRMGMLRHGNTIGNFGYSVSYVYKGANNMGPTWYDIHDVNAKLKWELNERSSVGVKIGYYDELSNSTYVGITQTMYDQGGQDFVRLAPDDLLPVKRYNGSISHEYDLNPKLRLSTTLFAYTTSRDWRRQEFGTDSTAADRTGVVWGDPSVKGGAIYMRDRAAWRNRQFAVMGAESKVTYEHGLFGVQNKLQTGIRYLYEKANEQFIQSSKKDGFGGNMRDFEYRTGNAISLYALNETDVSEHFSLNYGLRLEQFTYERDIRRGRFTVNGTPNVVVDTQVVTQNDVLGILPGAGFNWNVNNNTAVFGGYHTGFAPPRTKDAITSEGLAYDIERELSHNFELGLRYANENWLSFNATAFTMLFENQIIPVSQSSGMANQTGLANGGRTHHIGIEGGFNWDVLKMKRSVHSFYVGANATYVRSRYAADRFISVGTDAVNVKGNRLPYAPEFMLNAFTGFEHKNGLGLAIYGNYVGAQFTDELNTVLPGANGQTGKIDARFLLDATAFYTLPGKKVAFNLSAKNLTNERYIASRRPQGIKVGLGTFVSGGVTFRLGQ